MVHNTLTEISGSENKSSMMLSYIMKEYGLNPKTTKLVRHSLNDKEVKTCFHQGYMEEYQAIQKYHKFKNSTHIMSFIGEKTGTTAIFLGLYEVKGHYESNGHLEKMPKGYPFPKQYQVDSHWYDLKKIDVMSSLEGKLKIEWGKAVKQWCQNGTTDKIVLEYDNSNTGNTKNRIVFCNIAYMKYYDTDISEPAPVSGGSFVKENGFGFERNNFHVHETKDGKVCRGFVEIGHSGQWSSVEDSHKLNISRIDSSGEKDGMVKGVTVVFCATKPDVGSVIVGWYRDATAYRNTQSDETGNIFNFLAASENCVLLPEDQRVFSIPRNKDGGFGRSNVWYACKDESMSFVSSVMRYISLNPEQSVAGEEAQTFTTEEYIKSGKGKRANVNIYERNAKARRECLRKKGYKCFVCDFESSEKYGDEFKEKIEVHHIIPISERKNDYKVDPVNDLIPVCPNCHTMLHVPMPDGTLIKWQELRHRLKQRQLQTKKQ